MNIRKRNDYLACIFFLNICIYLKYLSQMISWLMLQNQNLQKDIQLSGCKSYPRGPNC